MKKAAEYWIQKLKLKPHPEGGYYQEIYKASEQIKTSRGLRAASTSIYFLLKKNTFSAFHRIKSDEIWHFYSGGGLTIWMLNPADKKMSKHVIGGKAGIFQAVVPAGVWFGASLEPSSSYALAGCTVAPGFDFSDFELGSREALLKEFPKHKKVILSLTHPPRKM